MTPRRFHELSAAAQRRGFRTEQAISAWLDAQGIHDPTDRIALKLEVQAAGELQTDQGTAFDLATDRPDRQYRPQTPPVSREMAAWLQKARLSLDRTYTHDEISEAFLGTDLDVVERMAVRAELMDKGLIRSAASRTVSAGRSLRASAERPKGSWLRDARGRLVTLRSIP